MVDKGVDYANYFCTYSFLYHQKDMLSDRVRMNAYFNSIFKNKHHFLGKVCNFPFYFKFLSLLLTALSLDVYFVDYIYNSGILIHGERLIVF